MVYRVSPENVRPPRGGPTGLLALLVVLALTLAIWLAAGRDPGTPTFGGRDPDSRSAPNDVAATDPVSGLPWVAAAELTPLGIEVLARLGTGRALPDAVQRRPFDNTSGLLPEQAAPGYYTELTVGSGTLLVTGVRGERYWSDDAGVSFERVGP